MSHKTGSVIGGVLLVTGSCVGAGMLGLPILTGLAGFYPALAMFFVVWAFMVATSFLLVEVGTWFPKRASFISMTERSLGKWGRVFCWVAYLFLFYALLVAYIAASGSLLSTFIQSFLGAFLPAWIGGVFFVLLFGSVVYVGTRQVDFWNRVMMVGKILFFLALIGTSILFIQPRLLTRVELSVSIFSLPILIIAFGFHNMIPSLSSYLGGDVRRVRQSILGGSLFAFAIYIIWEILVLGIVPFSGPGGLLESYRMDKEGSQAISCFLQSPWPQLFAQGLAFFAILTSFLAQALSFVHFLADGLKIPHKDKGKENIYMCLLALLPPLIFSLFSSGLFFKALNFAGGICAVSLFGVLPVLMIWIGRYRKSISSSYRVFGGKPLLVCIFSFAIGVFLLEICTLFGWISLTEWLA